MAQIRIWDGDKIRLTEYKRMARMDPEHKMTDAEAISRLITIGIEKVKKTKDS